MLVVREHAGRVHFLNLFSVSCEHIAPAALNKKARVGSIVHAAENNLQEKGF